MEMRTLFANQGRRRLSDPQARVTGRWYDTNTSLFWLAVLALCQVGEVLFPNLADLESPTPRDISTEAESNSGAAGNSTLFQPWTPAAPGKGLRSVRPLQQNR